MHVYIDKVHIHAHTHIIYIYIHMCVCVHICGYICGYIEYMYITMESEKNIFTHFSMYADHATFYNVLQHIY